MGISGFFVVPHDAVLHRQVLELAVVADSHVRADGAVLDGDILPDDARGNQPGIVNGIPLVDGGAANIVEFVLVLQQPCVRLHKGLREPAVQPFADRRCAELTTLLDHHLQSVSQLELTTSADVVIHQVFQRCAKFLDILDVIDADDSLVTHKFLRLFYKSFDTPVLVSDRHTKTSGILHLVSVQNILVFARELSKICIKQRVAENDEQGFVIIHIRERKTYCLPQALRVVLEHGTGLAPFGLARQVAIHGFGLVASNEDCLGGGQQPSVPHNPIDDGLSADGQQALGQVVGVGAHALALAGNGQNDLHVDSLFMAAATLQSIDKFLILPPPLVTPPSRS